MNKKPSGYKIKHSKTGLYLKSIYRWTNSGKVWLRKGDMLRAIREWLSAASAEYKLTVLEDCVNWEIIELYEVTGTSVLYELDRLYPSE